MHVGSFPKDFGYGPDEYDHDASGSTTSENKPRILLMGLRRYAPCYTLLYQRSKSLQYVLLLQRSKSLHYVLLLKHDKNATISNDQSNTLNLIMSMNVHVLAKILYDILFVISAYFHSSWKPLLYV